MKQVISSILVLGFFTILCGQTREYTSVKIDKDHPVIDGVLNDSAWNKGEWMNKFTQFFPYNGEDATQKTEFKVLHDDNFLYIAVRAYDTHPELIENRLSRKDNYAGDCIQIAFDSFFDRRTAYGFLITSSGVKMDEIMSNDNPMGDINWEAVWDGKSNIDSNGWTTELKIPFSQLRFDPSESSVWGMQVSRMLARKNEMSVWSPVSNTVNHWVSKFGNLRGLDSIEPQKQFDIVPYTVGKIETLEKEEGNPFSSGNITDMLGGIDGKIGITNDFTLDFTVNPDFGQVEADPSVVNLSAFETFFNEKRPFFIEGNNLFNFQVTDRTFNWALRQDNLFYSRRIGRSPQYSPDLEDDEYIDSPVNTNILGALKLTGKTRNGLSVGIMETVTGEEKADVDYLGDRRKITVEPLTNYFVARVQKDFDEGNTVLGTMFTATNRNITDGDLNFLNKAAYTGGLDIKHKWGDNTYYVEANALFSHIRGDKEAITDNQESSRRYFQRPDMDHLSVDTNRTSMTGHGGAVKIGKQGGAFRYLVGYTWRSPELELNDVGFMRSADEMMTWGWIGYFIQEPVSIFRYVYVGSNYWRGWNFGGDNLYEFLNINHNIQFKNNWQLYGDYTRASASLRPGHLRGGPTLHVPGGYMYSFNAHTDEAKKWMFGTGGFQYWGDENWSRDYNYRIQARFSPLTQLSISIEPSFTYNFNKVQFVDNPEVGEGNKYIIGEMSQKTFAFNIRLNYSITPELSIEYYGQPFVSVGDYKHFKEVTNARAGNYQETYTQFEDSQLSYNADDEEYAVDENYDGEAEYSFADPNFNFQQFISNLVIRWEYVPGSTLFLVWSQGRSGTTDYSNFSLNRDMKDLFRIHPHNVFLLKFSYRIGL